MKHIIHVNQHKIRWNKKYKANHPVITVKTYKDNTYGHEAIIRDDRMVGLVLLVPADFVLVDVYDVLHSSPSSSSSCCWPSFMRSRARLFTSR